MSLKIFLFIQGILKLIQVSVVGKYFLFYVPFLNEKKNKRIILDDEKNKKFKVFNGC